MIRLQSVLNMTLHSVRKRVDCDPSARKKLKVLVDRVDEPEDKTSEETENAASVPQLKKTNELKLSPERSSQFDIYSGQVSNTYQKQISKII